MSTDHYIETRSIINALAAEGMPKESDDLRNAMSSGFTATEILMAVRWQLQQIDATKGLTSDVTKRRIRNLIVALDRELS